MSGEQRRKDIITKLQTSSVPISASSLAKEYSVTRQIIVADIALLRASGFSIRAEHKGYILDRQSSDEIVKRIVVKHGKSQVKQELYAIVDCGGKVRDVIVEHSVYGNIIAELNLSSRLDVDMFVEKINSAGVNPLSLLTEGVHVHTIILKNEKAFDSVIEKLKDLQVLVEY